MRRLLLFLSIILSFLLPSQVTGREIDSTLTISVLTCSPGQETYSLYGHTAIRVRGEQPRHYDRVYNYGVFDFYEPNFTWRFTLGECDYMLYGFSFEEFLLEYRERGSSVTEQVLNLLPYEAARLVDSLAVNSWPKNRFYRYNVLRNNCTTKARDIIEWCIDGEVEYLPFHDPKFTHRQLLHRFTAGHPWAQEGNDLLLGADADTLISQHEETFLPLIFMEYADKAVVHRNSGTINNLVKETRVILAEDPVRQQAEAAALGSFPLSPMALGLVLIGVCLLIAFIEWRLKRIIWPVDIILMALQGVMGVLVLFMVLFSAHPTVSSNWQLWVLNPVPLIALPFVVLADIRRRHTIYHAVSAVWLACFFPLMLVSPQDFSVIVPLLALSLLIRAIIHLILYRYSKFVIK